MPADPLSTPQTARPDPLPPLIRDRWAPERPIPLSGPLERHAFGPLLMAALAFAASVATYLLVSVIAAALLGVQEVMGGGGGVPAEPEAVLELISPSVLLIGNAVGQVAGFLVFVLLLTKGHTPDVRGFLRFRPPPAAGLGLGLLGVVVAQPLVQGLGVLNRALPLPESVLEMEAEQMALIEDLLLGGEVTVWLALLLIALTPAICEEVLFRGYLHRQVERASGGLAAAIGVGVVFGLFHLRLSQALPLAALGVYFGVLVWATGSLWVPVAAHLLNNGAQVILAFWLKGRPDYTPETLENVDVPVWLVAASALAVAGVVKALVDLRARAPGADGVRQGRPGTARTGAA